MDKSFKLLVILSISLLFLSIVESSVAQPILVWENHLTLSSSLILPSTLLFSSGWVLFESAVSTFSSFSTRLVSSFLITVNYMDVHKDNMLCHWLTFVCFLSQWPYQVLSVNLNLIFNLFIIFYNKLDHKGHTLNLLSPLLLISMLYVAFHLTVPLYRPF